MWPGVNCIAEVGLADLIVSFAFTQAFFLDEDLHLSIVQYIHVIYILKL